MFLCYCFVSWYTICTDISADCGLPTIIKYSTLSPGGNLQGDKRTYTCASSTVQEGNPVIECLSSGMWSQTDLYCRRKWRHSGYDNLKVINIVKPFLNEISEKRYLQKILQRIIFKKIISTAICGEPPAIDRAVISAGGIVEGSTRTYTCNVNTVTEGSTMITCGPTGKWSVTSLYCRRE